MPLQGACGQGVGLCEEDMLDFVISDAHFVREIPLL